jgi:hypothetical protein
MVGGTITMLVGSAIYLSEGERSWHVLTIPGMALIALGAVLAFIGKR